MKTLKKIEDGELDQNEGSYLVGELLKKIYVDSALRREKNFDEKSKSNNSENKQQSRKIKNVTYSQYKTLIENCEKSRISNND